MDFKVAGTTFGITALQMDIKIRASPKKSCRLLWPRQKPICTSLSKMQEAMGAAKTEVSDFAPRLRDENQSGQDP
jgi:polyribonucleotide nucleotidyltransferase